MTYADILILLKAGYTKDEIDAMDQPEQAAPAAEPETQKAAEPETQKADPAPDTSAEEQAPAAQPAVDPTQQILQKLTELVRSVQSQNLGAAEIRGNIIEPGAQAMDTLRSLGGIPAAPENK